MYMNVYVYMYIRICKDMCVYIYMCIYTCVYICIHMHAPTPSPDICVYICMLPHPHRSKDILAARVNQSAGVFGMVESLRVHKDVYTTMERCNNMCYHFWQH